MPRLSSQSQLGVADQYFEIKAKIDYNEGRGLNPLDQQDQREVAVIGTRVEQALFNAGQEPVGKGIRVGDITFTVVGVFKDDGARAGCPSA